MRELKFRAWDKTSDVMRTDISSIDYDSKGNIAQINVITGTDILFPEKEAVLMQYTGLKDKNGVEIYEGDILASDPLYDGFQTFSTIEMGWSPVDGNEYGWHWRNGPPVRPVDMVDERYSVIGNIYESPTKENTV